MKANNLNPFAYLESLNINKMHFGLKSITQLLLRLGNPQKTFKTIIIAGTNGKGSTAAMTASILHSAGYKVGLYTSPHLMDVRERIVINGRKISRNDFSRTVSYLKNEVQKPVTYFEFLTAVAFEYFKNQKIDIAVLEVGLGGRLDATNVCRPLASVITNIAFDHTAYLGSTLESIAGEKAGIIKKNGVCVTATKHKKVRDVLEDVCLRRKAKLYMLGRDIKIRRQKDGLLTYQGLHRIIKNLMIPLLGRHQLSNAALALATIELCERKGFAVDDRAIHTGLQKTHWEARMEILQNQPFFLLDGAHNPAGVDVLCRSLIEDFSYRRLILIFGSLADKDYKCMLAKICPLAQTIILAKLNTPRGASLSELGKIVQKMGRLPVMCENTGQAIKRAFAFAGKQDLICATGSFYLAGEIKKSFLGCRK